MQGDYLRRVGNWQAEALKNAYFASGKDNTGESDLLQTKIRTTRLASEKFKSF
jgi:hypothetical protein